LVQRGEFLTSLHAYQAEITQGTLQAIFEFQTMIAELTAWMWRSQHVRRVNGAAERLMMAVRVTGRHKAVVAATVHPEYREVLPLMRSIKPADELSRYELKTGASI